VAVKQLVRIEEWDAEKFEETAGREADNLKKMNEIGHPNFIKGIAYYRLAGNHFFIFPWAEEGNLEQYWAKADRGLASTHCWALDQMAGLASGIHALHRTNYRHGDLKPQNILCFTDPSRRGGLRLVIADVGLAKVHKEVTDARRGATKTTATSIAYSPPEFDLDARLDEPASRSYDIWSIGCVFLEFVLWLARGQEDLKRFRSSLRERREGILSVPVPFWEDQSTLRLRPEVEATIDYLLDNLTSKSPLHALVEIIQSSVLVIKATSKGGRRNPDAKVDVGPQSPVVVELIRSTSTSMQGPRMDPVRVNAKVFANLMSPFEGLDEKKYKVELAEEADHRPAIITSGGHLLSPSDARQRSQGVGENRMAGLKLQQNV
jgi:serine/threonine protein kinase